VTGFSIDYNGAPWAASDGSRTLDLDGRDAVLSGVEQTFATVAGKVYVVSFDLSGNPGGLPAIKRLRVSVDGVTHDYQHDSSGQNMSALTWQSLSFSFVASGSSATLVLTSLQETPNSWGPMIDRVSVTEAPPAPCLYSFSSGAGAAHIRYCVSATGTLVSLQAPSGQEHIGVGQVWEGYVVCTGTTVQAWDLSADGDGFGAPIVIGGPSGTGVAIRRVSAHYQLDQVFKLDSKEKDLSIEITLINISGATIPDVRLVRAFDPDINNDFGDDLEVRTARSVSASDVDGVALTGTTWAIPTDTAIDTAPVAACSPVGAAAPQLTGDASLASVTYRLGSMGRGAKKKAAFVYRLQ
jgi:choice-of-anchor C domain-containing protein